MKFNILILVGFLLLLPVVMATPTLTVTVPPIDRGIYNSTSILVQLSVDNRIKSNFYYADIDDSSNWRLICSKTLACNKNIRIMDGKKSFLFKAVDILGEESDIVKRIFTVDSVKPVILTTSPAQNSFVNGDYSISVGYTEANLKNVEVYAGEDAYSASKVADSSSCSEGKNKVCSFRVSELVGLDDGDNVFWFVLTDIANNQVKSKVTKIKIDTKDPGVTMTYSRVDDTSKVKFVFDVKEDNFNKISYTDTNNCKTGNAAPTNLCTKLSIGRCVVTKSFCIGTHHLTIETSDKAGNLDVKYADFTI